MIEVPRIELQSTIVQGLMLLEFKLLSSAGNTPSALADCRHAIAIERPNGQHAVGIEYGRSN